MSSSDENRRQIAPCVSNFIITTRQRAMVKMGSLSRVLRYHADITRRHADQESYKTQNKNERNLFRVCLFTDP